MQKAQVNKRLPSQESNQRKSENFQNANSKFLLKIRLRLNADFQ